MTIWRIRLADMPTIHIPIKRILGDAEWQRRLDIAWASLNQEPVLCEWPHNRWGHVPQTDCVCAGSGLVPFVVTADMLESAIMDGADV